jgi:hypothetical protein
MDVHQNNFPIFLYKQATTHAGSTYFVNKWVPFNFFIESITYGNSTISRSAWPRQANLLFHIIFTLFSIVIWVPHELVVPSHFFSGDTAARWYTFRTCRQWWWAAVCFALTICCSASPCLPPLPSLSLDGPHRRRILPRPSCVLLFPQETIVEAPQGAPRGRSSAITSVSPSVVDRRSLALATLPQRGVAAGDMLADYAICTAEVACRRCRLVPCSRCRRTSACGWQGDREGVVECHMPFRSCASCQAALGLHCPQCAYSLLDAVGAVQQANSGGEEIR